MGNSNIDKKINQVSEMKHLTVKENFDYYNSIIDEIQENLDRLIVDFETDKSEYETVRYIVESLNLDYDRRDINRKLKMFDLFKYSSFGSTKHSANNKCVLFRFNSLRNFVAYWKSLSHTNKIIYENRNELYNYIPLKRIKKLAYAEYYTKDILKELNVDYKISKVLCNHDYILININDLDKLTWMKDKYHPLSLKEFIETYNVDRSRIYNYLEMFNIELGTPYNKKDKYFKTQEDWDKIAEFSSKSRNERTEVMLFYNHGKTRSDVSKELCEKQNAYIKKNKIFTSVSGGKYLGINEATFKKYIKELNLKPIGKVKKNL